MADESTSSYRGGMTTESNASLAAADDGSHRSAADVLRQSAEVRVMLAELGVGEQNATYKKMKMEALEPLVRSTREILDGIAQQHALEEERQDAYDKEIAAMDVAAAQQELSELEAEAQEKEAVWAARELAIKRARTLALKEREAIEKERDALLKAHQAAADDLEATARKESDALQAELDAALAALQRKEAARKAAHADEELRIQMDGLALRQSTLEQWMELSALHSNAEKMDSTAASSLAAMVITAESTLTGAENEVREAEARVATAQAAVDEAERALEAAVALAAASRKEAALEEAEKIRKAEEDLTMDGLTAAEQRARVEADAELEKALLVKEREDREVAPKERRIALAAKAAADAVDLAERHRRVGQLRDSAAASSMEAAVQHKREDEARRAKEAAQQAAQHCQESGLSEAQQRIQIQVENESARRRQAEQKLGTILSEAVRAESTLRVQLSSWEATRAVRAVWAKAESAHRGAEKATMHEALAAVEKAERDEAAEVASLTQKLDDVRAKCAADVAAAEAELAEDLANLMGLFRDQKELGDLQLGDRLVEAQATARRDEAEEADARLQAEAAESTARQYTDAADAEQERLDAEAAKMRADDAKEEAEIAAMFAGIKAQMDGKEAEAAKAAAERAAWLNKSATDRKLLQEDRLAMVRQAAEEAKARVAADWEAKLAAARAEMEAGPLAMRAQAQANLAAAEARRAEAAAAVEARRTEANKGAAMAARSANIFAREKAKHVTDEKRMEAELTRRLAQHAKAGAHDEIAAMEAIARSEDDGMKSMQALLAQQREANAELAAQQSDEMVQFDAIATNKIARLDAEESAAVRTAEKVAMQKSLAADEGRVHHAKARAGNRAGLIKQRAQEAEDYEKKVQAMAIARDRVLEKFFRTDQAVVVEQTQRLIAAQVAARERDLVHARMTEARAAAAAAMELAERAKADASHERQVAGKRKVMWQTAQARAQVALSAYQQMVSVPGTSKDDPEIVAVGEDYAKALAAAADAQPPALMSETLAAQAELTAQQLGTAARIATQHAMLSTKKLEEAEHELTTLCKTAGIPHIPVNATDSPQPPLPTQVFSWTVGFDHAGGAAAAAAAAAAGGAGGAAGSSRPASAASGGPLARQAEAELAAQQLAESERRAMEAEFAAERAAMLAEMARLDAERLAMGVAPAEPLRAN